MISSRPTLTVAETTAVRGLSGADPDDLDIAGVGLFHPVHDDVTIVDVRVDVDGEVIVDDDVDHAEADPGGTRA